MTINHPLQGVYAASVTPFDDDGYPALHVLSTHLRHLEANRCHGALILGTTGEGPSLSLEERLSVLKAAAAERGDLKLLAGTGAASLADAIALTRASFEMGYDGVVTVPPFYYKAATVDGLFEFYREVVTQAVPAEGYLLLYHIPQVSGVAIKPELIRRLRDVFPSQVAGIKDSGGSLENMQMLCETFEGFQVFSGSDGLVADALAAGGAGAITAPANLFSKLLRDLFDAHRDDLPTEAIDPIQTRLAAMRKRLTDVDRPFPSTIKAVLHMQGLLPNDFVRPPLLRVGTQDEALLRELFDL
jgi:4-hydroxy-tetrahydrodipicolinate synthase